MLAEMGKSFLALSLMAGTRRNGYAAIDYGRIRTPVDDTQARW
jgi:hypothetical protein